MTGRTKATHASIHATDLIPGYRVTIFRKSKVLRTSHFQADVQSVLGGVTICSPAAIDSAYRDAKRWAAGFGVS